MRGLTLLIAVLAALLVVAATVRADTPADCRYETILGLWTFSLGPAGQTNAVNCTQAFTPTSTLKITLGAPNIALDDKGNQGTWTMIYSQGFEVTIAGRIYFAFSKWVTNNGKVTSLCGQTLPGWVHNSGAPNPANWGCFVGNKVSSVAPETHLVLPEAAETTRQNKLYIPDAEFVDRLNSAQTMWTATLYKEHFGHTIGELERRAGGRARDASWARFANRMVDSSVGLHENSEFGLTARVTPASRKPLNPFYVEGAPLPTNFDWTNVNGANYVSPVRDQGHCGSCYAFASLAMLEARIRIISQNQNQPILSTQDVVSCSEYSQGCDGGFSYLIAGKYSHDFGAVEESCFPYTGTNSVCSRRCANPTRHYVADYYYIGGYFGSCTADLMMEELVKNGPFAVGIMVDAAFQQYQGGIWKEPKGIAPSINPFEPTNHAVLVVGYGVENGVPFWKIKNSWGGSWGEKGYIRMVRGSDEIAVESMGMASMPVL